jgi:hypothetical protein
MIPKEDEENPPNARHLCGDALPDPKKRLKGLHLQQECKW